MVYSDDYSKISKRLKKYCRDETVSYNDGDILNFDGNNITDSPKSKAKKYYSNLFWELCNF